MVTVNAIKLVLCIMFLVFPLYNKRVNKLLMFNLFIRKFRYFLGPLARLSAFIFGSVERLIYKIYILFTFRDGATFIRSESSEKFLFSNKRTAGMFGKQEIFVCLTLFDRCLRGLLNNNLLHLECPCGFLSFAIIQHFINWNVAKQTLG